MPLFLVQTIQRDSVISFPMLGGLELNPPAFFTVFGFRIYFYGVLIALGFVLAMLYCSRHAPRLGIKPDDFFDLMLWLIPIVIVGARAYYVLFRLDYYLANPGEILAVRDGGLAIYGGVIAGVLVIWLVCRHKKISLPAMMDLAVQGLLIGQIIGRWGNFMNREAFGAETEIFCRMGLTPPGGETVYVHPTFLYESLWNLAGLIFLVWPRPRLDRGAAHRQPLYREYRPSRIAAAEHRALPAGAGRAHHPRTAAARCGEAVRQQKSAEKRRR